MSRTLPLIDQRLVVSSDVSIFRLSHDDRRKVWSSCGLAPTLKLVSKLLTDLDLAIVSDSVIDVEMDWTGTVPRPTRADLRRWLRRGNTKILTSAALLQWIKEVIEFCDEGTGTAVRGKDLAACILGINHDLDDAIGGRSSNKDSIESSFAINQIAQQSFNYPGVFETTAPDAELNWRRPWPESTGRKIIESIGSSPGELFSETIGIELDDFLGMGWLLFNITRDGQISFDPELLREHGATTEMVATFLERCTIDLMALRNQLSKERDDGTGSPWSRYKLLMTPFVKLSDGKVVLLRFQYLVQRFFGQPLFVDVNEDLKRTDPSRSSKFRTAVNHQFEVKIGDSLNRIVDFDSDARSSLIHGDTDLVDAFKVRKGQNESICDYALVKGNTCILVEVNNRHLLQEFAEGTGTLDEFRREIQEKFSGQKFVQLIRTIEQFDSYGWDRDDAVVDRTTLFVPLVIGPEDGIPSNPHTERMILSAALPMVSKFGGRSLAPSIITWRELRVLEGLAEHRGTDVVELLVDWRRHCEGESNDACSLNEFMSIQNLDRPMGEFEHKIGFDFFEILRRHMMEAAISQLPPERQKIARQQMEGELKTLPTEHLGKSK